MYCRNHEDIICSDWLSVAHKYTETISLNENTGVSHQEIKIVATKKRKLVGDKLQKVDIDLENDASVQEESSQITKSDVD